MIILLFLAITSIFFGLGTILFRKNTRRHIMMSGIVSWLGASAACYLLWHDIGHEFYIVPAVWPHPGPWILGREMGLFFALEIMLAMGAIIWTIIAMLVRKHPKIRIWVTTHIPILSCVALLMLRLLVLYS